MPDRFFDHHKLLASVLSLAALGLCLTLPGALAADQAKKPPKANAKESPKAEPKTAPKAAPKGAAKAVKPLQSKIGIRVARKGWGGDDGNGVKKILDSTANELWILFPKRTLDPIYVRRSHDGPIVLFKRSPKGEHQVKLDIEDLHWSQYAFQFGHEVCHILCNYRDRKNPNKWFEESLCELASLFVLRRMAKTWKTSSNRFWRSYAPSHDQYAQQRIDASTLPKGKTLAKWYRENEPALRANATDRKKNNIVAVVLLPLFEKQPQQWQALSAMNKGNAKPKESFKDYLIRWRANAPKQHKSFIDDIAKQFDIKLPQATTK